MEQRNIVVTAIFWAVLLALCPSLSRADEPTGAPAGRAQGGPGLLDRLPTWALPSFESGSFQKEYALDDRLNPFYVAGDFDSDQLQDLAVLISERSSGKEGVGILLQAAGTVTVLGAGKEFGGIGPDWRWVRLWRVETRRTATLRASTRGDMLFLTDLESRSGIVSRDSTGWIWTPLQ